MTAIFTKGRLVYNKVHQAHLDQLTIFTHHTEITPRFTQYSDMYKVWYYGSWPLVSLTPLAGRIYLVLPRVNSWKLLQSYLAHPYPTERSVSEGDIYVATNVLPAKFVLLYGPIPICHFHPKFIRYRLYLRIHIHMCIFIHMSVFYLCTVYVNQNISLHPHECPM